jgi:glutathione S-transferase
MTSSTTQHPKYELLYHPGIPGRGEFIRLAFEAKSIPYTDIANEDINGGYATVQKTCMNKDPSDHSNLSSSDNNPPVFAPPALRVPGAGKQGQALVISQTPNILVYLGKRLGLVPEGDEAGEFQVYEVLFTALDLNNEVHDTHHPIAVAQYYEDQKEEALKKSRDVRENRLSKYLSYFERTLRFNEQEGGGQGKYLVGESLTIADLAVWQVIDGLRFAFPKEMEARLADFPRLLGGFYDGVKHEDGVKEYLGSKRRLPYGQGVFRYYAELDRQ